METKLSEERVEALMKRLVKRPGLFERVEELVGEIEKESGQMRTLEEVEEKVVERSRALGLETLKRWLGEAEQGTARPAGARKGAKKKSGA